MIGNYGAFDFLGLIDNIILGEAKQENSFENNFIRKVTTL